MSPPVLAYHLVDRRMDAGIAWIPPQRFERQMAWLADAGYQTISISEYLQHDSSTTEKKVVITFDDGYRSLVQYALPILARHGFRATVFVIAGYVGQSNRWDVKFFWPRFQHLDWGELRELMAAGWEVGSHSLNHNYLPLLSDQDLHDDLHQSRRLLQDHLQMPVNHLSLPFGRGDWRVYQMAKSAGYVSVATLGSGKSIFKNPQSSVPHHQSAPALPDLYFIPRRGVYLLDSMRSFRRLVQVSAESKWQTWRQSAISTCAMGTVIVKAIKKDIFRT
jgi:peptidoglycan/xylan/chitin deacetylase (PgdA/CDA1 family)